MKLDLEPPTGDFRKLLDKVGDTTLEFMQAFAPTLFKWIEWSALFSLVVYARIKTGLWPLTAIEWVLMFALWGHFMHYFTSQQERWVPASQVFARSRMLATAVAFLATLAMVCVCRWLAGVFSTYPLSAA